MLVEEDGVVDLVLGSSLGPFLKVNVWAEPSWIACSSGRRLSRCRLSFSSVRPSVVFPRINGWVTIIGKLNLLFYLFLKIFAP